MKKENSNKEKLHKRNRNIIISISLVLIVTFFSFYPVIDNNFVYFDDPQLITENAQIRILSIDNVINIFTSYHEQLYHPLVSLSFAIEYNFFKLNPKIYHFDNLLLHLVNCLLVFWLIFSLVKDINIAFLVGLFFGIHPVHVEPVAWASGRKTLLYSLFFLGSLIAYIYYKEKRNFNYYFLALILFIFSLLSKVTAVTLPLILILLDYFHINERISWSTLKYKIPFFILSIILGIIGLSAYPEIKNLMDEPSFYSRITLPLYILFFHITKTIVPLNLSIIYQFKEKIVFYFLPVIVSVFLISFKYLKEQRKLIFFGSLFFLINLLPVLRILNKMGFSTITSDRYNYLPSIGLIFVGVVLIINFRNLFRNIFLKASISIITITVIGVFSIFSWQMCDVWQNSVTLWSNVLKKYPNFAVAYNARGGAYLKSGEYKKAIADYNEALRNDPNYYFAWHNRGVAYAEIGEYKRAIISFNNALKINPAFNEVYYKRGLAYFECKKYIQAISDYTQSIMNSPNEAKIYNNRGGWHMRKLVSLKRL